MIDIARMVRADLERRRAWDARQQRRRRRVAIGFAVWLAVIIVLLVGMGG